MPLISYIVWSPNPDIISIGAITIRWYGFLFALGFIISQQIMFYIYKKEGKPEKDVETLTIFMVIATIIGARLGHVLFYQPDIYLRDPISILKIWEGGLASHGAAIGIILALYLYSNFYINISFKEFKIKKHKREGQSFFWVIDRIVIVVALTGCLIRFGNFMNSEIVGIPTGSNYGVVFAWNAEEWLEREVPIEKAEFFDAESDAESDAEEVAESAQNNPDTSLTEGLVPVKLLLTFVEGDYEEVKVRQYIENEVRRILARYQYVDMHFEVPQAQDLKYTLEQSRGNYMATINLWGIPRHPAQLYESISSLLIFFMLFFIWKRKKENTINGKLFAIFLVVLFSLRFLYEFLKENQVEFEEEIPLNMGQWLSIPLILAGIIILIYVHQRAKKKSNVHQVQ